MICIISHIGTRNMSIVAPQATPSNSMCVYLWPTKNEKRTISPNHIPFNDADKNHPFRTNTNHPLLLKISERESTLTLSALFLPNTRAHTHTHAKSQTGETNLLRRKAQSETTAPPTPALPLISPPSFSPTVREHVTDTSERRTQQAPPTTVTTIYRLRNAQKVAPNNKPKLTEKPPQRSPSDRHRTEHRSSQHMSTANDSAQHKYKLSV